MDTRQILIEARKLIENPQNFTTGAWARDVDGTVVNARTPSAVCWCSEGAIRKVVSDMGARWEDLVAAEQAVTEAFGGSRHHSLASYNDDGTHADAVAAFSKAISSLSPSDDRVQDSNSGAGA